jgi:exopolysaccharide biosynthesis polyprenyl glycosylphosphotransferase
MDKLFVASAYGVCIVARRSVVCILSSDLHGRQSLLDWWRIHGDRVSRQRNGTGGLELDRYAATSVSNWRKWQQPRPPRGSFGSPSRRRTQTILVLTDAGAILLAMAAATSWSPAAWAYVGAMLLSLGVAGGYQPRISLQALAELPALLGRLAIPALLLGPLALVGAGHAVFLQVLAVVGARFAARTLAYAGIRRARRKGYLRETTLIVGVGTVAAELARLMKEHPEHGLEPIGFVDGPSESGSLPLPHLGSVRDLETVLRRFNVHRVLVAFGRVREADWVSIMRAAVANGAEIHVVPRFFDVGMVPAGAGTDQIWGIPLCRVRRSVLYSAAWRAKRAFDLACAGCLLLLTAPLLAVIAVAVRCSSSGPILFRQHRIGQHGHEFELLKFRSMRTDHDGRTSWAATDEQQTAVGRWLRRSSLDELPQLWNVVRGDMSLIGPRPERPHFARRFSADIPGYRDRHRLPVGLTGWAQVHGLRGNDTSLTERARFDNFYIESWSLWLDAVILIRTITAVIRMAVGAPSPGDSTLTGTLQPSPDRPWTRVETAPHAPAPGVAHRPRRAAPQARQPLSERMGWRE